MMGKAVNEGDILGYVADPFGTSEDIIRSPVSGLVVGQSTLPLVHSGEALFNVARLDSAEDANQTMQQFDESL